MVTKHRDTDGGEHRLHQSGEAGLARLPLKILGAVTDHHKADEAHQRQHHQVEWGGLPESGLSARNQRPGQQTDGQ